MNGAVSKTVVGLTVHRGFESLPLRKSCLFAGSFGADLTVPVGPSRPLSAPERPDLCSAVQRTCSAPSLLDPSDRAFEIAVEESRGLLLGAGEEVPVAVERDGHGGVPEEGREGLRVDARGDHQRREGVAAFVQADRVEPGGFPGPRCSLSESLIRERPPVLAPRVAAASVLRRARRRRAGGAAVMPAELPIAARRKGWSGADPTASQSRSWRTVETWSCMREGANAKMAP